VHDWDEHKRLLTSFWASVALRAGSYRGNPMGAHRPHPIRAEHFDRWLALWRETCAEELDETAAATMREYAERIGRSLKYGLGLNPQAQPFGVPIVGIERRREPGRRVGTARRFCHSVPERKAGGQCPPYGIRARMIRPTPSTPRRNPARGRSR
jgi:hemoglobin